MHPSLYARMLPSMRPICSVPLRRCPTMPKPPFAYMPSRAIAMLKLPRCSSLAKAPRNGIPPLPALRRRRRPAVVLWWLWLLLVSIGGGLWRRHRSAQVPPAAPSPPEHTTEMPVAAVAPLAVEPGAASLSSEHPTASLPKPMLGIWPGRGRHNRPSVSALARFASMPFEAAPSFRTDSETATHRMTKAAYPEASETAEAAAGLHTELLAPKYAN